MIIAYLEKHDPERNMHRFYRMSICRTLFGQYALIREWGRCTTTFGGGKKRIEVWQNNPLELISMANEIATKKQRKGYVSFYLQENESIKLDW